MAASSVSLYNDSERIIYSPSYQVTILENKRMVRQGRLGKGSGIVNPQPRITGSTSNFVKAMSETFPVDLTGNIRVWVPEALIPALLDGLHGKKRTSRRPKTSAQLVKKRISHRAKKSVHSKQRASPQASKASMRPPPVSTQPLASGSGSRAILPATVTPPKSIRYLGFIDLTLDSDSD